MHIIIIISAVFTGGFLWGIRLMQDPRTAVAGNRLGAFCMIAATLYTIYELEIWTDPLLWLLLLAGGVCGALLGGRVKMIAMPQMVALLNGLGGAASALVAGTAVTFQQNAAAAFFITAALALASGMVTFVGSIVAVLKLNGNISQRPVIIAGHKFLTTALLCAAVIMIALAPLWPAVVLYSLLLLSAAFGCLMTLRIGGADMPITISLLNSLSGVAAAICGLTVSDPLLTAVGAMVGVAGLILTRIMCRAMNRSLAAVLAGFTPARLHGDPAAVEEAFFPQVSAEKAGKVDPVAQAGDLLNRARSVIIVPGYGMAVAQAQQAVRNLIDALEAAGKEVRIAIHPVAGRMPGHMNVLLAEVGVEYDKLYDIEAINPLFAETDLAVVVGACDVVNPAANTAEGTPIYGMPILEVQRTKHVIVCNLNQNPGYSGVENSLYQQKHVVTIWGDAAEIVPKITGSLTATPKRP